MSVREASQYWPCSQPIRLDAAIDWLERTTLDEPSVAASGDLFVEPPGQVNAIALTFRAELYGDLTHTLDP